MACKVGDVRWNAWIDDVTGEIEFEEWVCRTIRRRKNHLRALKIDIAPTAFWIQKINGLTWVKLSNKHFDWGFAESIPAHCRTSSRTDKPPYSASKEGAIRALAAHVREHIKSYGADTDQGVDDDGKPFLTYSEQLKRIVTAQKRLKAKSKS